MPSKPAQFLSCIYASDFCDFIWGIRRLFHENFHPLWYFVNESGKCSFRWRSTCPISVQVRWNLVTGTSLEYALHQYKANSSVSTWFIVILGRLLPLGQECWSRGWRRLLIVVLCLLCPLNDWADINHSRKKLSHLLSIYTCVAKADSLFTWADQTGLRRTHLARGKYQGK